MKKNFIKKVAIGAGLGASLLLPLLAMAQPQPPALPGPVISSPADISKIITSVYNGVTGTILLIAIIMILYAAFLYMTAGASETTMGKAKTALIYAVVGLVIAILAFSLKPFLVSFLGGTPF